MQITQPQKESLLQWWTFALHAGQTNFARLVSEAIIRI
jgi:hypothetical protein